MVTRWQANHQRIEVNEMKEKIMLMEGLIDESCHRLHLSFNQVAQMLLDNDIHSLNEFIKAVYVMAGVSQDNQ